MSRLGLMSGELRDDSPTSQDKYDQADVIAAIKQTVAKGASDAQLKMFIEVCRSTGLNPWLKEIWFVAEKSIIMAGRDGYLRVANENPNFDGLETRVERDERGIPIKAVCTVWRKDRAHPVVCEAYYNEYKGAGPVWSKYPSAMISKVSEVLALKRSFAINGVVTEEEIGDQGGSSEAAQAVAQEKIAAMQATAGIMPAIKEPAPAPIIDAALDPDPPTLHDDIQSHPPAKASRKPYDKFAMYAALEGLKKRFLALGAEAEYRRILGLYGATKRTELPTKDGGAQARAAYKEMSLCVADLEIPSPIPEVTRLPDAIEQVIGTVLRCGGKTYLVADSADGQFWKIQPGGAA